YFLMVTGSAAIGELGSRFCAGQHSLFLLSPATVFVCGAARKPAPKGVCSRPIDGRTDQQSFQLTGQPPHSKLAATSGGPPAPLAGSPGSARSPIGASPPPSSRIPKGVTK